MTEISHKLAEHLANEAARYTQIENGRSYRLDSDWTLATEVFHRLQTETEIRDSE